MIANKFIILALSLIIVPTIFGCEIRPHTTIVVEEAMFYGPRANVSFTQNNEIEQSNPLNGLLKYSNRSEKATSLLAFDGQYALLVDVFPGRGTLRIEGPDTVIPNKIELQSGRVRLERNGSSDTSKLNIKLQTKELVSRLKPEGGENDSFKTKYLASLYKIFPPDNLEEFRWNSKMLYDQLKDREIRSEIERYRYRYQIKFDVDGEDALIDIVFRIRVEDEIVSTYGVGPSMP